MTDGSAARQLDALGDPTRRRTLELLRTGEQSVAELTAAMPVSQSAVSQHLKVLKDAGLVIDRAVGRRRLYRVDLDGLAPVRSYLDRFWDGVLDAFTTFAASESSSTEPAATETTATGGATNAKNAKNGRKTRR